MPPCTLLAGLSVVHGLSVRHGWCWKCLTRQGPPAGPAPTRCSTGPFWVPQVTLPHEAPRAIAGTWKLSPMTVCSSCSPPRPGLWAIHPSVLLSLASWQHSPLGGTRRQLCPRQLKYLQNPEWVESAVCTGPWVQAPWSAASPFPPRHLASDFQGNIHNFVCPVLAYTDLFLAVFAITLTPAYCDLKVDKLSVSVAFAFRRKLKPLLDF